MEISTCGIVIMERSHTADKPILSRTNCLEIVEKDLNDNDFILKSYEITRASSDLVGFMGEYYKLKVEIKEEKSNVRKVLKYFMKCIPFTNPVYRDECERKGFFGKESSIYRDILPHVQQYANVPLYPKSYLARKDVIVLEDLSLPEKCLKQLDENQVYSLRHYQLFLQHLAKLHAASLAWESKEGINIGEQFQDILFELQMTTSNDWYTTGIKGIIYVAQNHPQYQYPEAQEFIQTKLYNTFLHMEELVNTSTTLRNVLCHRDSWDRNIFWEYKNPQDTEPIACRVVDFQLMRYSPPAIDVLNFLYNNFLEAQERDEQMPHLLSYYYESLKTELKRLELSEDLITRLEFDEDCRRVLLPVITLRAICYPLMRLPKGWAQMARATEPEIFDGYMNSDRREMFQRISKIDHAYKDAIQKPVQEIMEYFGFKAK